MRTFGHIPDVPVGTQLPDRRALFDAGVHRQLPAGIAGSAELGAESVVVSGGYEDDDDFGDLIIYTGQGGNNTTSKQQIADQSLTRGNLGLAVSSQEGLCEWSVAAIPTVFTLQALATVMTVSTMWMSTGRHQARAASRSGGSGW